MHTTSSYFIDTFVATSNVESLVDTLDRFINFGGVLITDRHRMHTSHAERKIDRGLPVVPRLERTFADQFHADDPGALRTHLLDVRDHLFHVTGLVNVSSLRCIHV